MADSDPGSLKALYQNLADEALSPGDKRYVPLYDNPELAPLDPVADLQTNIEWAGLQSVQLFTGFRGSGKSTELKRLRRQLQASGDYLVVLCDMEDYLNLTTELEISDFLMALAGAFSEALKDEELLGQEALAESYWERFVHWVRTTTVELEKIGLGGELDGKIAKAGAELELNLKADPSFKQRLQEQLRGRLGLFVEHVRAFMVSCVKAVRAGHSARQVVLLLDSIEHIHAAHGNAEELYASVETVFASHADKLKFQGLHVVYTVPPWLKIRVPGVAGYFDGSVLVPCVKVMTREGERFTPGIEALRGLVQKRGDFQRLLGGPEALDELIYLSGGHLRDLLRLLQSCLRKARGSTGALPEDQRALAVHELRNQYLPLSHASVRWLARVLESHGAELQDDDELPELSRFFDTHLVNCYRNGEEWYGVHPLLHRHVREVATRLQEREGERASEGDQPDGDA